MLVQSSLLRWLARPLLPRGWTPGSFQTTGEVDAQRIALRKLGTRLAVLSIFSFLCKAVSVATSYFAGEEIARSEQSESVIFLVTILSVEAVPSLVTLLLLDRFHFGRSKGLAASQGALMQSLLTRQSSVAEDSSASYAAAAVRQKSEKGVETWGGDDICHSTVSSHSKGCAAVLPSSIIDNGCLEVPNNQPGGTEVPSISLRSDILSHVQVATDRR